MEAAGGDEGSTGSDRGVARGEGGALAAAVNLTGAIPGAEVDGEWNAGEEGGWIISPGLVMIVTALTTGQMRPPLEGSVKGIDRPTARGERGAAGDEVTTDDSSIDGAEMVSGCIEKMNVSGREQLKVDDPGTVSGSGSRKCCIIAEGGTQVGGGIRLNRISGYLRNEIVAHRGGKAWTLKLAQNG